MTGQPLKQEDDRINESPLVRVLQRHFRKLQPMTIDETTVFKQSDLDKIVEHAPTPLSNPFWNSNGAKEQEER